MKKLLLILMVVVITAPSCRYMWNRGIRGDGNIKTEEHAVSSFKNVEVSGNIDLYISQGDNKPVKIETDQNLQQYIEVSQEGDKIVIKFRDGVNLHPSKKIKAYVTSPVYNTIDVSGASTINGEAKITNPEKMTLQVSGAGDINLDVNAPAISVDVSGAGDVKLKGETKTFDLDLTGAGKAHCYELLSENTKVDISGAGDADVYASVKLDAQVSGVGNINYKGGATDVAQQVSGAGSVKKVN
jgi:hypothetical protein